MLSSVPQTLRPRASSSLDEFADAVHHLGANNRALAIDCGELRSLSVAAIRVLESESHRTMITVTNASPVVCLLATVFGLAVEPRVRQPLLRLA